MLLTKTLKVTEILLMKMPVIKETMGEKWPLFWREVQLISKSLDKEPNSDFTTPLTAAFQISFHTPAEPVIAEILRSQRFDYRFITGQPRRFSALKPGREISPEIQEIWQRLQKANSEVKKTGSN